MIAQPRWFRRVAGGVTVEEVQRFDGAFSLTATELRSRRARTNGDDARSTWDEAAETEITNAASYRASFELDAAWSALKAVERHLIGSMDPSELVAHARSVRHQGVEKLTGWRQSSIDELLSVELLDAVSLASSGVVTNRAVIPVDPALRAERPPAPADDHEPASAVPDETHPSHPSQPAVRPDRTTVLATDLRNRTVMAQRMLDTHSDNVYHKYRLLRRAVLSTSAVLGCFLVALVATVALGWVPDSLVVEGSPLGSWRLLCVVMCLGVIGAFLSSATELTGRHGTPRIPELRVNYTLMGMRPIVGAAGSVVVIVLLQSAFAGSVSLRPNAVLGVAIVAGFTERLVTRTITAAAGAVRD